jgi:hypothetical protein
MDALRRMKVHGRLRQAAEKLNMGGVFRSFVTGHDFSRAANASK